MPFGGKKMPRESGARDLPADRTGLEPATSAVTGRHSNQLNYRSNLRISRVPMGLEVRTHAGCRAFGARQMRNFRDGKDRGISFFSNEL